MTVFTRLPVLWLLLGSLALGQTTTPVTYDALMKKPVRERKSAFTRLPAETKAALMKTHLERCREAYATLLASEQLALVDQAIALMSPGVYEPGPASEAVRTSFRELSKRTDTLFAAPFRAQIFTLNGTIPQKGVVPPDPADLPH